MSDRNVAQQDRSKALARIADLSYLILSPQIQQIIHEQLLTPAQRKRAKSPERMKAVSVWASAQRITEMRAVIELARLVNLISEAEAVGLRRRTGGHGGVGVKGDKPHWDLDRGELRLGDQVIRRIARPSLATDIVPILNAFQKRRWPARIDDPLSDDFDSQRLREAIASLNKGLQQIRFRADGTGKGVVWVAL